MASPRSRTPRPTEPWRPKHLKVWGVYARERKHRIGKDESPNRRRRATQVYDVRYQVDEHWFRYGFEKKALADEFADALYRDFVTGCLFDPAARRFVAPDEPKETAGPTFYEHAGDHFRRKWPTWSPIRRMQAQRELARACLDLVRDETPELRTAERVEADGFLRRVALMVPIPQDLDDVEREWDRWFLRWSLPLRTITDAHLAAFLEGVRTKALDGTPRTLAPNTLARTRAVVGAAFRSALQRRLIDWNPWEAVEWRPHPEEDQIDPDLVMDQAQVFDLADAVAAIDRRYECFVLIQGLCALRPSEARDLRRRDFDLTSTPATVTAGGSWTDVPGRFLDKDESRRRPLKGRGPRARRPVPIPSGIVPRLREHLDEHVDRHRDALVFTSHTGRRINLSNFGRNVWAPAKNDAFPADSPLRRVRRHDLRHAGITAWLNSGVTLKTAQRWSGHKRASVLLDTYLGVMRDDEAISLARVEEVLERTVSGRRSWQVRGRAHGKTERKGDSDGNE